MLVRYPVLVTLKLCLSQLMNISKAERNQIENEMIFRRMNEKVGDGLEALDAMHIADDDPHLIHDDAMALKFRCECSDENCHERIELKLTTFSEIHTNRDTFVVKKDHQVDPIETVIREEADFSVVMKNNSTAEPGDALNETTINNGQH